MQLGQLIWYKTSLPSFRHISECLWLITALPTTLMAGKTDLPGCWDRDLRKSDQSGSLSCVDTVVSLSEDSALGASLLPIHTIRTWS